jgi:platelet-activating factor acetylhydrolase IB subunit alpha
MNCTYAYLTLFYRHTMSNKLCLQYYIYSHQAMVEYLEESGLFPESVAALKREARIEAVPAAANKGMLEKKWTSVVRLQKKVMELEAKLAAAGTAPSARLGGVAAGDSSRMIPKAPARSKLSGHRGPITCVATHPVYR